MQEPGIDEDEWIATWSGLEPLLADSPSEALPEADDLVAEMLVARGFPLGEEPGQEIAEPETIRSYEEARRIRDLIDNGESVDPSDIGLAVQIYRDLYDYLLNYGPTAGDPA
jgi:hypothetical protein